MKGGLNMDSETQQMIVVAMTIITIVFLISSAIVYAIYLNNEQDNKRTPYQKCTDDCMGLELDNTLKVSCKANCTSLVGKQN